MHAKDRDAETTRRVILAAAAEEFADKGYSGARVDAIARRAGYNKSLIFQYFGNKLGLYRDVIASMRDDLETRFTDVVEPIISTTATLDLEMMRTFIEAAIQASFDMMVAQPNLRRILTWEAAENWETYSSLTEIHVAMRQKTQIVLRFVERARQAGLLRPDLDTTMLYFLVMSLSIGYLSSLPRFATLFPERDFMSPAELAAARAALIDLVLHGTLTSPQRGA